MKNIAHTLKTLGLSQNETTVYLALTALGEAKGSQIAKKANLSRTTTLSILERLAKQGYLTSNKYHGTIYYWIESPSVIKESFKHKVRVAEDLSGILENLYRSGRTFPTGRVYDTKTSIKLAIEKIILSTTENEIYTIDSPGSGNYQKVLSDDYGDMLLALKNQKQLLTKTLVPFETMQTIEPYKVQNQNIEIKELPPGLNFTASIWLIDKQLVLFSGNPPFMTVLVQPDLVNSFKQLFNYFWNR